MADLNHYDVTVNGRTHAVHTPHHHDDHDGTTFQRHLVDVLKGSISGFVGGAVTAIVFKGKVRR